MAEYRIQKVKEYQDNNTLRSRLTDRGSSPSGSRHERTLEGVMRVEIERYGVRYKRDLKVFYRDGTYDYIRDVDAIRKPGFRNNVRMGKFEVEEFEPETIIPMAHLHLIECSSFEEELMVTISTISKGDEKAVVVDIDDPLELQYEYVDEKSLRRFDTPQDSPTRPTSSGHSGRGSG